MADHLFVYGTLLPEHASPDVQEVVASLKPVSSGHMPGRIYDLGDFPGAVFDPQAKSLVHGQVFELSQAESQLQKLDEYEEFEPEHIASSLFVRQRRPIDLADGSKLQCWVYVYNHDPGTARSIPGGDYSAWTETQHSDHSASP